MPVEPLADTLDEKIPAFYKAGILGCTNSCLSGRLPAHEAYLAIIPASIFALAFARRSARMRLRSAEVIDFLATVVVLATSPLTGALAVAPASAFTSARVVPAADLPDISGVTAGPLTAFLGAMPISDFTSARVVPDADTPDVSGLTGALLTGACANAKPDAARTAVKRIDLVDLFISFILNKNGGVTPDQRKTRRVKEGGPLEDPTLRR